ncbi:MAG: hypothetical protein ABIO81_06590 [Ginsengibacter sp.]
MTFLQSYILFFSFWHFIERLIDFFIYNNNKAAATYTAYVYGYNGAFSSSQCYTLNIQLSATNFNSNGPDDADLPATIRGDD